MKKKSSNVLEKDTTFYNTSIKGNNEMLIIIIKLYKSLDILAKFRTKWFPI